MSRHEEFEPVEFLDTTGRPLREDTAPGPARRPARRWFLLVTAAVLVAVAVVGWAARSQRHHAAAATPSVSDPSSGIPDDLPSGTVVVRQHGGLSVLYVQGQLLVLTRTRLTYQSRHGDDRNYVPFPELPDAPVRFVADPDAGLVAVVTLGASSTRILEFAVGGAPANRPALDLTWNQTASAAAMLDRRLVLTTPDGGYQLTPGSSAPVSIPGLAGAVGDVVSDPTRHRFIFADLGDPTELWTFDGSRVRQALEYLSVDNGTFAVVGGHVWVAGNYRSEGLLAELDPVTLRAVNTYLDSDFGRRALIVGTGERVFWIRDADFIEALCIDADTGQARAGFVATGPVTSASGQDAVGSGAAYYARYALNGCPG